MKHHNLGGVTFSHVVHSILLSLLISGFSMDCIFVFLACLFFFGKRVLHINMVGLPASGKHSCVPLHAPSRIPLLILHSPSLCVSGSSWLSRYWLSTAPRDGSRLRQFATICSGLGNRCLYPTALIPSSYNQHSSNFP